MLLDMSAAAAACALSEPFSLVLEAVAAAALAAAETEAERMAETLSDLVMMPEDLRAEEEAGMAEWGNTLEGLMGVTRMCSVQLERIMRSLMC